MRTKAVSRQLAARRLSKLSVDAVDRIIESLQYSFTEWIRFSESIARLLAFGRRVVGSSTTGGANLFTI
jgi:hypothetical protein